jgi:hypothetical protein
LFRNNALFKTIADFGIRGSMGEAEWSDRGSLRWCCCAERSPSPFGALQGQAA